MSRQLATKRVEKVAVSSSDPEFAGMVTSSEVDDRLDRLAFNTHLFSFLFLIPLTLV